MNEHLQHKLYNYQVQPPAQVWDKITAALEEPLSERLTNYEQDPPSFVWNNIVAALDNEVTPVIPFRKRFSKPLRYSTAAASLIAVAVLVSLLINKKSVPEIAVNPTIRQNISPLNAPSTIKERTDSFDDKTIKTKPPHKDFASNRKTSSKRIFYTSSEESDQSLEGRANYVVPHNYAIEKSDLLDRYILFSTAPGEAFRVSKKLFDLFACSDNDENCKHNIEVMQQRAATSSVIASADFSGVLDLLQNIENQ